MSGFDCKICGGRLEINVDSGTAVCDSCGAVSRPEPEEIRSFVQTYRAALTDMGSGTVKGYEDAILKFRSIPFVAGTNEKIEECRTRIKELEEAFERRETTDKKSGGAGLGAALIIVAVLILLACAAGVVYVVWNMAHGTLSPTAKWIAIGAAVLAAVCLIAGKLRG